MENEKEAQDLLPSNELIEIINSCFGVADVLDENISLLTTDQVLEKINDFTGIGISNFTMYNAMKHLGFKISSVGDKLYWRVLKK